jgi:hypothetical protein
VWWQCHLWLLRLFFSLLPSLFASLSQRLVALFWSIWKHRNIKVCEDVTETYALVVERTRSLVEDWKLANGSGADTLNVYPVVLHTSAVSVAAPNVPFVAQLRWQAPEHGCMKCNIDAAFFSHRNRTDIDIYIRDEGGVFVLAKTVSFMVYIRLILGKLWVSTMLFNG